MTGLLYVVSAFGLGALHALEPGHGKSMMAAYLVGSRGRPWDAIVLGIVVTLTHTLSVYILALVTLVAARYLAPAWLEHTLELVSGLLVLAVGAVMVWQRVLSGVWERWRHQLSHAPGAQHSHAPAGHEHHHDHGHHDHGHAHSHDHAHGHAHSHALSHGHAHSHTNEHAHSHSHSHGHGHHHHHDHGHSHSHEHGHHHAHHHGHPHPHSHELPPGSRLDTRALVALGVSGGLVPCPSALAVLLTAVAAGGLSDIVSGMGLVAVFSLGLASVLIGLGLGLVFSAAWLEKRTGFTQTYAPLISQASAWFILALGLFLTVRPLVAQPVARGDWWG